jgi:hypothetical protein
LATTSPTSRRFLVILWVAIARKIPTAVLDSVGQIYRQPIATIRDINLHFKITQKSKAIGDEALSEDHQSDSLWGVMFSNGQVAF